MTKTTNGAVRTTVRAGGRFANHVPAVRTQVQAGGRSYNHAATARA